MARFKYLGESPNGPFVQFGGTFEHGGVGEVMDASAVEALRGHPLFEEVTDEETPKKKGARPRKEVAHDDAQPDGTVASGDGETSAD